MTVPLPAHRARRAVTKRITVPGNLRLAGEQFNAGLFFECHETLEELWQHEHGELRNLYKGVIQVAAAFVHLSRGNYRGANRLFATALSYLARFRDGGAMGLDADAFCEGARRAWDALVAAGPAGVAALDAAGLAPALRWDESRLRFEAIHWAAWGFDAAGEAVEMEITVIE